MAWSGRHEAPARSGSSSRGQTGLSSHAPARDQGSGPARDQSSAPARDQSSAPARDQNRRPSRSLNGEKTRPEADTRLPPAWNPSRNPPAMRAAPLAPMPTHETAEPAAGTAAAPYKQKSRWLTALAYFLAAAAVILFGLFLRADRPVADRIVVPDVPPTPAASPTPKKTTGNSGDFGYAPGYGPILGASGPIMRYRIAVEQPSAPHSAAAFAKEVDRILGDKRSWIAGRRFRLQRVPVSAHAAFTVYLASARTSQRMCRAGGLETKAFTSCRVPRRVIINDDRWEGAVRGYGAPLSTYRAYVINHEVGHEFGHGHERCPGKGRPAPVMMQQTYGLKGCVANPWPYRNAG